MHPNDIPFPHNPIDTYFYCREIMNKNGLQHWRLTFLKQNEIIKTNDSGKLHFDKVETHNYMAFCQPSLKLIALNPEYYGNVYFTKNSLKRTIYHEIAHAIVEERLMIANKNYRIKGTGHHKLWQQQFKKFGYSSKDELQPFRLRKRYL